MGAPAFVLARRRAVLRRWLRETGRDYRDVAERLDYDPSYVRKLTTGECPITDSAAWRLRFRLGVPLDDGEAPCHLEATPANGATT